MRTILLTGRNHELIGDFFKDETSNFICITTSMRSSDILNHMKVSNISAIVLCMNGDSRDDLAIFSQLRQTFSDNNVKLVLAGPVDDCQYVQHEMSFGADLVINKPFTSGMVLSKVSNLLSEQEELVKNSSVAAEREEEKKKAVESVAGKAASGSGKKHVLVIDDDPMMLKIMKEHLHNDYEVATAVNGKIALKFLEMKSTNLILLDYEMPVMSGPEVLSAIRSMPKLSNTPVVFLTGTKDKNKVQTALKLKPQGYLLKPIEKDKLMETIQGILG